MMSRLLKILSVIIGIILIIIIAGYFAVKSYLNPAVVRRIAERISSEAIQRPVELGKVGLKFGFKVGITIDDAVIADTRGFSSSPIAQIDRVTLNLKLLPLLRRQIIIGGVELSGMKLKVERNKKGELNFATLIPKEKKGSGWALSLSSIKIIRGEVHYVDIKENIEIRIKDIDQGFKFKKNKVSTSGRSSFYLLKHKTIPEMVLKVENRVEYDTLSKNIEIERLSVSYDPIVMEAAGNIESKGGIGIEGDLRIGDLTRIKSLIPVNLRPVEIKGKVKSHFAVTGKLQDPQFDGHCELKNVSIVPKGMERGVEKISGAFSFNKDAVKNILLQGRIGGTELKISGAVTGFNDPRLNITAKVNGDLRDFESMTAQMQGISMQGPLTVNVTIKGNAEKPFYSGDYLIHNAAINGIGLQKPITDFYLKGRFEQENARIERCSGHIGSTDFSFNGVISDFKKLKVEIHNSSNLVDLDELLPDRKKSSGEKKEGLPLLLNGDIHIKTLTGLDMVYKNVKADFSYENGIIKIDNGTADAFDGKVDLDFYYNSNNPEPYKINTRMTSVSTKKILKRFLKFENLEGRLNGVSNFSGKGFGLKEVVSNLSASGNIKVNNGAFKNFVFLAKMLEWLGMKNYKDLSFKDFNVSFRINKGKAAVDDWVLSSSVGDILTNGTIGLDGTIKLYITTTLSKKYSNIVKQYHGDWIFPVDKKGRATIDLIASGKLLSPKFSLDKNKIKKRIKGKIKNEFNKKKKEWEKKLKKLFGGK